MNYESSAVSPFKNIGEGQNLISNNYFTYVGMFVVIGIILFVVAIVLGMIQNVVIIGVTLATGGTMRDMQNPGVLAQFVSVFVGLFTNLVLYSAVGSFACGFYTAFRKELNGVGGNFGDMFAGFDKIAKCAAAAVAIALLQLVFGLVFLGAFLIFGLSSASLQETILRNGGRLEGPMILLFIGIFVFAIVFNVVVDALTVFIYPLIAERGAGGFEAVGLSVRAGLSNIFGLIGLMLIKYVAFIVAAIPCLLGLPFVVPIFFASQYMAFISVFGKLDDRFENAPPTPQQYGFQNY